MGKYIDWGDVVDRHPVMANVGDAIKMESTHILPAENEVDARLAPAYTVPFSSNNATAADLAIQLVYLRAGFLKEDNWTNYKGYIDERFERLLDGSEAMLTSSGDVISSQDATVAYHTHEGYKPVFDLTDAIDQEVDPDLVDAEDGKRL
jgi:hypothetical protein